MTMSDSNINSMGKNNIPKVDDLKSVGSIPSGIQTPNTSERVSEMNIKSESSNPYQASSITSQPGKPIPDGFKTFDSNAYVANGGLAQNLILIKQ